MRFEALVGSDRQETVEAVMRFYAAHVDGLDPLPLVARALDQIAPHRSHTFREGGVGGWREVFNDEHRALMKRYAGDLLIELGYESDLAW